jgi:hypothetical protein
MSSYNIEDVINFPKDLHIDLTHYENIKIRYGACVYKIDIEKFLKEFGSIVEIVYDSKVED